MKGISRRHWLKLGAGASMGALAAPVVSRAATETACGIKTQYETMGPFYPNQPQPDSDLDLTRVGDPGNSLRAEGEVIEVVGQVTDENCEPVERTVVTLWQASKYGKYSHEYDTSKAKVDPNFQGSGTVITGKNGEYRFITIKPGAYPVDEPNNVWRTPHIHFKVARRGFHELITQLYFEGESLNDVDMFASGLSDVERPQVVKRPELKKNKSGDMIDTMQFDLVLAKVDLADTRAYKADDYVGRYVVDISHSAMKGELAYFYGGERDQLILDISQDGGLLYAEMPIQPISEIFFKSDDRFLFRAFEADIAFTRDNKKRVNGLNLHRHYEFPTLAAKKLT